MEIYISDFYHVRFFKENMIPIATSGSWPYWMYQYDNQKKDTFYLNNNNVMIGIREELFTSGFMKHFDNMEEKCGAKPCPYLSKVPHCQFMDDYCEYLKQQDFTYLIGELNRVVEDVHKISNFQGEPIIVLLVYESSKCPCAERPVIQQWFRDNGYELKEWTKDLLINESDNIF